MEELKRALFRFVRVMAGQAVGYLIAQTSGLDIPYLGLSVGAILNTVAKYLRDKFGWDWLPV